MSIEHGKKTKMSESSDIGRKYKTIINLYEKNILDEIEKYSKECRHFNSNDLYTFSRRGTSSHLLLELKISTYRSRILDITPEKYQNELEIELKKIEKKIFSKYRINDKI